MGGEGFIWLGSDGVSDSDVWLAHPMLSSDAHLRLKVMRGLFTLSPSVPRGPAFDSYAARLRSLPSTAPRDGEEGCSYETDDEGTPIWLLDSSGKVCTGASGEEAVGSVYAPFVYDATYALAHALHDLVEVQGRMEVTGEELYRTLIHRVRFEGVTGTVAFSGAAEDEGDRLYSAGYTVKNYRNSSAQSALFGYWRPCDHSANRSCTFDSQWEEVSPPVFSTSDNSLPLDASYASSDIVLVLGIVGVSYEFVSDSFSWLQATNYFGADLARRTVNADKTLLPGRNISFFAVDTRCSSSLSFTAVEIATQQLQRGLASGTRMVGFLGAQCSSACRTVASYGALAKIPQVSHGCTSTTLNDPSRYPYFNRVIGVDSEQAAALSELCAHYNWTRVALLTDSGTYGLALKETIISSFSASVAVALTITLSSPTLTSDVEPLKTADTPVIILAIGGEEYATIATVIIALEDAGVSAATGYQLVGTETTNALLSDLARARSGRGGILFTSPAKGNQTAFNDQVTSQFSQWYRDTFPERVGGPPPTGPYLGSVSPYAAYMYDAVMLFAHSLHALLEEGGSAHDPDMVVAKLRNVTINGLTGRFGLDASGQRAGEWIFNYLAPADGVNYIVIPFGTHSGRTNKLTLTSIPTFGNGLTTPPLAYFPPDTPSPPQARVVQAAPAVLVVFSWRLPPSTSLLSLPLSWR